MCLRVNASPYPKYKSTRFMPKIMNDNLINLCRWRCLHLLKKMPDHNATRRSLSKSEARCPSFQKKKRAVQAGAAHEHRSALEKKIRISWLTAVRIFFRENVIYFFKKAFLALKVYRHWGKLFFATLSTCNLYPNRYPLHPRQRIA